MGYSSVSTSRTWQSDYSRWQKSTCHFPAFKIIYISTTICLSFWMIWIFFKIWILVKVGRVTSYTSWIKGSGHCGLGYIKRNTVSEGSTVIIEDSIVGTVVDPPFLARQHPPSKSPSSWSPVTIKYR